MKPSRRLLLVLLLMASISIHADEKSDSATSTSTTDSGTTIIRAGASSGSGGGGFGATLSTNGGRIVTLTGNNAFFDADIVGAAERPAIISTQPIDASTQSQFKEDLSVMDKLLRDEIARVSGNVLPKAMGIPLRIFGGTAPMYVESCGVIFNNSVNLALSAADESTRREEKPGDAGSAWDRAKSELEGGNNLRISVPTLNRWKTDPPKFDQTKVNDLVDSILKLLPEASHIRAIKADEFVIVTIAGTDDAGKPIRLTMKVKKSDIDDAASGKLKPEEFKQRVAQRIG